MKTILYDSYNKITSTYHFMIGKTQEVCELSFLCLAGLSFIHNNYRIPKQWTSIKSDIAKGYTKDDCTFHEPEPKSFKQDKCAAFIQHYIENFCDHSAYSNMDDVYILPFDSYKTFYQEYFVSATYEELDVDEIACYRTFCRAIATFETKIRLMRCKGNFSTCEVCNNAAYILRTNHKWSKEQRDIILKFRRNHLKQQATERQNLEFRKELCRKLDENNQPKSFMVFSDAMTNTVGDTPKIGKSGHQSSADKNGTTAQTRTIGVQVVCGPVEGMFLYHTSDFVKGGANIMVEVQRLAMSDLARLLAKHGMRLPKHGMLQFDNCPENKNKEMFCYFSLLIELGILDRVEINFLIVGHTHCCIDQYFSVLSGAVKGSEFIGSPTSIQFLYQYAHSNSKDRPLMQRVLHSTYDYVKMFQPYVNKVVHYLVPHSFLLYKLSHKCIMKYRMFSSFTKWLPEEPIEMIGKDVDASSTLNVAIESMAMCGGDLELAKAFELASVTGFDTVSNSSKRNLFRDFTSMLPALQRMNAVCLLQLNRRFEFEGDDNQYLLSDSVFEEDYKIKDEIYMDGTASNLKGYIYWIKSHTYNSILPTIRTLEPELLVPRDILKRANIPQEQGNKKKSSHLQNLKSHYLSAAKTIVLVAARVMNDTRIEVSTSTNVNDFCFNRMRLSISEANEYKQVCILREEGVIDRISDILINMDKWKPIDLPNIDEEVDQSIVTRNMQLREDATAIANTILVKNHHNTSEHVEIIHRQGYKQTGQATEDSNDFVAGIEENKNRSQKRKTQKK